MKDLLFGIIKATKKSKQLARIKARSVNKASRLEEVTQRVAEGERERGRGGSCETRNSAANNANKTKQRLPLAANANRVKATHTTR